MLGHPPWSTAKTAKEESVATIHPGRFVAASLIGFLVVAGATLAAQTPEDAAQAVADSWLKLVDGGDYPASWDQAASALKGAVKQASWVEMAEGVRSPLGGLVSRTLKSREYTEKMPTTRVIGGKVYTWGSGRYVVLQYDTVFANRASAVETVIPMADPDGAWRVSAYSIR
jgi:hypothetical protein